MKLNWNQAAERVTKLIDQSLYLKPADYSRMPSYEREQMANRVIGFYHRLPDEVERPFKRELLNEDARKKLPTMLADPEQAVELLEKMDAALLSVPLDSPEYAEKSKTLAELHQYVEGTYTIFPEKKKAIEISASETGQISLFDIWVQEQESKEHSTTAVVEEPQKQAVKYSRYIGDYLYLRIALKACGNGYLSCCGSGGVHHICGIYVAVAVSVLDKAVVAYRINILGAARNCGAFACHADKHTRILGVVDRYLNAEGRCSVALAVNALVACGGYFCDCSVKFLVVE